MGKRNVVIKRMFKKEKPNTGDVLDLNKIYSEKCVRTIGFQKVPAYIRDIIRDKKIKKILDLGCGEGILVHAIKGEFPDIEITGIDISPTKINNLKGKFLKDNFFERDVCDTGLKDNSFELINCSQVVEHVESEKKLIGEMKRLLKKDGILLVDSVVKKPFAISKWRRNGKFVLDPTHEREYESKKEFLELFRKEFRLIKSWMEPFRSKSFFIKIRIPGYYKVHGIWVKK